MQKWLCPIHNEIFLNLEKRQYLSHFLSDKYFKGTVVNLALPILRGGSPQVPCVFRRCWWRRGLVQGVRRRPLNSSWRLGILISYISIFKYLKVETYYLKQETTNLYFFYHLFGLRC